MIEKGLECMKENIVFIREGYNLVLLNRVPLETKRVWLSAVVLSDKVRRIQATKMQHVNWWGYGIELLFHISEIALSVLKY